MTDDAARQPEPQISAVVCTRDRGDRIVSTLRTILANTGPRFEVVVVDQSPDDITELAVQPFTVDGRVRYIKSDLVGLGHARNTGMIAANAPIVAFTDDDVTVPPGWLATMRSVFDDHLDVAVTFCNVAAAEHDPTLGFVPTYERVGDLKVTTVRGKNGACGIGAGLAVRRSMVQELGGFDVLLGAGARFSSCEDGDIALRALLAGMHIFETDRTTVVHDGFRTWKEGRDLSRRDWYGIGAAYSKPVRAGRFRAVIVVMYEGVYRAMWMPLIATVRTRRPRGLKQGFWFWKGFFAGIGVPVRRETLVFRTPDEP